MAFNLLEALSSTIGTQLGSQGSRMFEESAGNTQSAVGAILPALLGGLMKQGSSTEGATGLMKLLSGPNVDAGLATNPGSALGGGANTNALLNSGANLLKGMFGDKTTAMGNAVSSASGVKSSSAIGLLSLALPMVLGFLKKYVTQNSLNPSGLMSLLTGQAGFLQGKLDNRVSQAMGLGDAPGFLSSISGMASKATGAVGAGTSMAGDFANRAAGTVSDSAQAAAEMGKSAGRSAMGFATQTADGAQHHGAPKMGRLLQWLLALIVLALLFAVFRSCSHEGMNRGAESGSMTDRMENAGQTALDKGEQAMHSAAGAMKSLALPGGATLNAPSGGFIEKIYTQLSGPAGGTSQGYALDAVTFETGSANLVDTSNQQLEDLATLMRSFPTAVVAINGFTDNTGDEQANRVLSQQRAEAVRNSLVGKGIAAERITATGYGSDQPIADNNSEEGKAKNRRVEVSVTKH